MSIWLVIQVLLNVLFFIGLMFCLVKIQKDREEDVRMAKGLRLLQNKIAVLEDLSDHTEFQSKQIMALLDKKMTEARGVLKPLDDGLGEIHQALARGETIRKEICEDLPHDQLFDKQQKSKYLHAAQLSHQGWSAEDISHHLKLPLAEIRLVQKVNQRRIIYGANQAQWSANNPKEKQL